MAYELRLSRTRSKSGKHWRYYATKGIENHNERHGSFSASGLEAYIATLPEDATLVNNGVGWWHFRKLRKVLGTNETIDECVDGLHCGKEDEAQLPNERLVYDEHDVVQYAGYNFENHIYKACKTGDLSEVLGDFWLLQEAGWWETIVDGFYRGMLKYKTEMEENKNARNIDS